jgi:GntR family transcriptional regulator, transcriptional repressor for pyruvate dehydrogenase complex
VSKRNSTSTLDSAVSRLRSTAFATGEGNLLGSEESLIAQLGVSRATVRQAARLLEREGLLRVRRGINGGYFAARPDVQTIATFVSAYLEVLHTEPEDATAIASVLWVEAMRRAAKVRSSAAKALAEKYLEMVRSVPVDASFDDVLNIEQESRKAIFDLINGRYIELVFQINTTFARRYFPVPPASNDNSDAHREFVRAWRKSKQLELDSIADGDQELAVMAARHSRTLWHRRLWNHDSP